MLPLGLQRGGQGARPGVAGTGVLHPQSQARCCSVAWVGEREPGGCLSWLLPWASPILSPKRPGPGALGAPCQLPPKPPLSLPWSHTALPPLPGPALLPSAQLRLLFPPRSRPQPPGCCCFQHVPVWGTDGNLDPAPRAVLPPPWHHAHLCQAQPSRSTRPGPPRVLRIP